MRFSQSPRDRDLRFLALSEIERSTVVLEWSLHCRGEGVLMPVLSTIPCMRGITDFGHRLVIWRYCNPEIYFLKVYSYMTDF